jgi:hypothetical protein
MAKERKVPNVLQNLAPNEQSTIIMQIKALSVDEEEAKAVLDM